MPVWPNPVCPFEIPAFHTSLTPKATLLAFKACPTVISDRCQDLPQVFHWG